MKDEDMPNWLPKRDGSTPILSAYELGFWKCPKCGHDYQNKSEIAQCKPDFSEWEHFIWCSFCKEQFPAMLWMAGLEAQEKKFLQHIKASVSENRGLTDGVGSDAESTTPASSATIKKGEGSPLPRSKDKNACRACGKYPATICGTCHNESIDAETKPWRVKEKSPPNLKGYTRFKTCHGGVWIKKPKKNPNMSRVQKWVRVYRINPTWKKAVEKALAKEKK